MRNSVFAIVLSITVSVLASGASASDYLVRFEGGIGVTPVSSVAGAASDNGTFQNVNRNDVRGVPPGGQPWVIKTLDADVFVDGSISVSGEGLLLSGGNNIGTNGNARVFATLFCGTVEHSTDLAGVPLDAAGDFKINDVLTPLPPVPCNSPVLLIRTANGGRWFAAGILK